MTTLTIGTTIQGWYANTGLSALQNNWQWGNTVVGNTQEQGASSFRSVFSFDLSAVAAPITSVTLRLGMELAINDAASERFSVWDITSPQASVLAGTGGTAAYADAGSGTSFGSLTFPGDATGTYTLVLNAAGLAAVNAARGGTFILGVNLDTASASFDIVRFGGYQGHTANQLVLVTANPPAAPVITGFSDDSGTPGDGLTNDATPTLTGTAAAGATVTIRSGTDVLGSTTAHAATGAWSFTSPTLAEGAHSLTATATLDGQTGDPSAPLAITVDTTPPAPLTLNLQNDTGISATDGVTAGTPANTGANAILIALAAPNEVVQYDWLNQSGGLIARQSTTADAFGTVTIVTHSGGSFQDLTFGYAITRTDAAGNSGTGPVTWVTMDNIGPTATLSASVVPRTGGTVALTFDEPVFGLTLADFAALNGSVSNLAVANDGRSASLTFTPGSGVQADGRVALLAGGVTDRAGNANAFASVTFAVDTQAPTLAISSSSPSLGFGETAALTFAFSEAVAGFTLDDLTVSGGTLSNFAGSGALYTATFTPDAGVAGAAGIGANGDWTDLAGNLGEGPPMFSQAYDTRPPVPQPPVNTNVVTAPITFTLTSNIGLVGLDAGDFSATLGAVTAVSGGGTAWAITYTPPASTEGTATVTLNGAGYRAANGSPGVTLSFPLVVDTRAPSVTVATSDALLAAGEAATITFTFSEAVTGLSLADLTALGGTLSALAGSGAVFTATFTPAAGFSGAASAGIAAGSYTDLAGNGGGAGSRGFTVDTVAPDAPLILALSPDSDAPGDFATRNLGPVTLSGTTEAGAALTIRVDGALHGRVFADAAGAWDVSFAGLADGAHEVSVTATDLAGNESTASDATIRLFSRVIEHTAWVNANDTTFEGDWGNDRMMVVGFGNRLIGSGGDDVLRAMGTATIEGGAGDDVIELTGHTGTILAGAGDDTVTVNAHGVVVDLGPGHDRLTIANGNGARITGGPDASVLLLNGQGHQVELLGGGHALTSLNGGGGDFAIAGGGSEVSLWGFGNRLELGAGGNDVTLTHGGHGNVTIMGGGNTVSAQGIGDAIGINGGGNTVTIGPNSSWTALAITGGGNTIGFSTAFGHLLVDGGGNTVTTGPNGVLNTIAITGGGGNDLLLREIAGSVTVAGDGNTLVLADTHYTAITLDGDGNSVSGSGMSDTIRLGDGDRNVLDLAQGFHTITGTGDFLRAGIGAGGNTLATGREAAITIAGVGFNTIQAGDGAELDIQGIGNAITVAGGGTAWLEGPLTGGAHHNTLRFGDGGVMATVLGGGNVVEAGAGTHSITLHGAGNRVSLGDGYAGVVAHGGFNTIEAGEGDSAIIASGAGNAVRTGGGQDGVSLLQGGGTVATGGGRDNVVLGAGWATVVDLGAGDDSVQGANNHGDVFTGGAGADRFAFTGLDWNWTRITDFTAGEDVLDLRFNAHAGLGFGDLVFGTLGGATTVSAAGRGTLVLEGAPVLTQADILFA